MTLSNNGPMGAGDFIDPLNELEQNLSTYQDMTLDAESCAKLNDLIKEIDTVRKAADKSRIAIKEPHLTASRKVDADFKPVITKAKDMHNSGKALVTAYLVEQKRIAEEERRKAEEEAVRKARIAEQLANDALIGEDVQKDAEEAARVADIALVNEANSGRAGSFGGSARTMSLRTSYRAEIENATVAAAYFADHPKVQDAIISAANALLRSPDRPNAIAGMKIIQEQKAA